MPRAFRLDARRLQAGRKTRLAEHKPRSTPGFRGDKAAAKPVIDELSRKLETLQELLYADGRHRLLVVLQGPDASGKDGVVRHVFEGVNPSGVRVASFKAPTEEELARDFLWRVHGRVPRNGEIVLFNRSHYEDVLVVRVRKLAPKAAWERRFDQINDFERLLVESGTTILKFFLHISREEQGERFRERIADPKKRWKFRRGDLEDRALWPQYQRAYQDVLRRTSTPWAPWYVIPADREWYRNLAIGSIVVETLGKLDLAYPPGEPGLQSIEID
jgi:PPK2 family polyphosphate:nucleotide phosphotransferase